MLSLCLTPSAPSLTALSPYSLSIFCFSDWNIFYLFFIDVGSILQQNLHNISFSFASCKV